MQQQDNVTELGIAKAKRLIRELAEEPFLAITTRPETGSLTIYVRGLSQNQLEEISAELGRLVQDRAKEA